MSIATIVWPCQNDRDDTSRHVANGSPDVAFSAFHSFLMMPTLPRRKAAGKRGAEVASKSPIPNLRFFCSALFQLFHLRHPLLVTEVFTQLEDSGRNGASYETFHLGCFFFGWVFWLQRSENKIIPKIRYFGGYISMVILLKILLHIIFCLCTVLLFCYWKKLKLWNHLEVVYLISLFKSLHKNISSLQVIQLPKIRPPVYFQWSYGKFHDFQCPTEAVRCFPSHDWLGPSRRMKTLCQAMQSVEANLDDLDDLHVAPQIWQMGLFKGSGLWFQFLITMQQKIEAFRSCSHLGPSKRKLVAFRWRGFVLEGQCGFSASRSRCVSQKMMFGPVLPGAMGDANVMKLSWDSVSSWLTISRILAQIDRKITSHNMDFSFFLQFISYFCLLFQFFYPSKLKIHQISIGDVGHGRKASWVMATTFSSHGNAPHGACVLGFGPGHRMRCPWRRRQSWAVGSWLELCGFEKKYGCFQK